MSSRFLTTGVISALFALLLPVTPAHAALTFEVEVGRFFDETDHSAESMRFYPGDLKVVPGDTLHFTTESFHGVTLLPAGTDPAAWVSDQTTDGRPWSTFIGDPDEGSSAARVNLTVSTPSRACGWPDQEVCEFDGNGDAVFGPLNSGLAVYPSGSGSETKELSFSVRITADPGDTIWVVDPLHPAMRMKVDVVATFAERSDAFAAANESAKQFAADKAKAKKLDSTYSKKRVSSVVKGKTMWQAWAGVEERGISLRRMYPKSLTIKPGQQVKWNFTKNMYEAHSVTFPQTRAVALAGGFPDIVCDTNGDQDSAADSAPSSTTFPFCSSFGYLELDVPQAMVSPTGDKTVRSKTDVEASGARGAAYAPSKSAYVLTFPARSPSGGFAYACAIHEAAHAQMRGSIVVKP